MKSIGLRIVLWSLAMMGTGLAASGCREPRASGPPPQSPAEEEPAPPSEPIQPPPAPEPQDPFHITMTLSSPGQTQPGWVRVQQFFNADQKATLDAKWTGANRIVVESRNVRQMSLDLGQLPVNRAKSVFLRLNGQGIQLSSEHGAIVEFQRGQAGGWSLLKN